MKLFKAQDPNMFKRTFLNVLDTMCAFCLHRLLIPCMAYRSPPLPRPLPQRGVASIVCPPRLGMPLENLILASITSRTYLEPTLRIMILYQMQTQTQRNYVCHLISDTRLNDETKDRLW